MIRLICWLLFGWDVAPKPPDRGCPECKKNDREVDWYLPYHSDNRFEIPERMTTQEKVHELYLFWRANLFSGYQGEYDTDDTDDIIRDGFAWMMQEAYGLDAKPQSEYSKEMGRPHPCVTYNTRYEEDPPEIAAEREWKEWEVEGLHCRDQGEKPDEFESFRRWRYKKLQEERRSLDVLPQVGDFYPIEQQKMPPTGDPTDTRFFNYYPSEDGEAGVYCFTFPNPVPDDRLMRFVRDAAAEAPKQIVLALSKTGTFMACSGPEFPDSVLELVQIHGPACGVYSPIGNLAFVRCSTEANPNHLRCLAESIAESLPRVIGGTNPSDGSSAPENQDEVVPGKLADPEPGIDFDAPPAYTPVAGGLITDTRLDGGRVKEVHSVETDGAWVWLDAAKKNHDWPMVLWVPNYAIAAPPEPGDPNYFIDPGNRGI